MAPNSSKHSFTIPGTEFVKRPLRETMEHHNVSNVHLADEHEGVAVRIENTVPARLWRVPVESVSLSEGGFERVFQSVAVLYSWELRLAPGEIWRVKFTAELADR